MKKLFFIWLALWIFFSQTMAQANFPPIYEITTDTVLKNILPCAYWQLLEDKDRTLSFEKVSKFPVADKFHYDTEKKINFQIHTYWFRFTLKNTTNHQLKIGFYDDFKAISDWYIVEANGQMAHKTSGLETPWSNNESLKFIKYFSTSINFLPIKIEPKETLTLYNRAYYNYFNYNHTNPKRFYIAYGSAYKVVLQNYVSDESHYFNSINDSFLFGVLFLAAIFNFFFFLIIREKTYVFFALYVFFLGLGRFNIESEFFFVFLREHPVFYSYFIDFIWVFSLFFLTYFIRSLLNVKKYYPRWDKFIFFFNLFVAALFLSCPFIDYSLRGANMWGIGNLISMITYCLLGVSLLITIFLFLNKNVFFDRRLLIAVLPSFTIWVVGLNLFNLINLHFLHLSNFDSWIINNWHLVETLCLIWQVICFSWLLFHRFVELKQQVVQKELEQSQLMARKTELELRALRAQMNPHFIFNCLSSINRFILINKVEEASDYLTKFSRLIRMALHNSEKTLITLENELEALRLYLDLERLRFKNAFNYSITFINTIDINAVYIPPMLIQPFAENAIWHGLMHKKGVGCLEIQLCAKNKILTCAIIDNGIGRNMAASLNSQSAEKNKSMGVEITAGRLALLNKSTNEAAVFNIEDIFDEEGKGCGTKVVLTIPYKDLTEFVIQNNKTVK